MSEIENLFLLLGARIHRYGGLVGILAKFGEIELGLSRALRMDVERLILTVHDRYVLARNQEAPAERARARASAPAREAINGQPCRQCGECCIGETKGPMSTSAVDLAYWEALGRDDLLYYTLPGSCEVSHRAESLHFHACPFLRFQDQGIGLCLVHPVKPLICREFDCGKA